MKCIFCACGETKVIDSRETNDGGIIRRRRECLSCGGRFSTYEQAEPIDWKIIKKDGRQEEYKKEKLREGIGRAANKRLSEEAIDGIVMEVEAEIMKKENCSISSKDIGEIVLEKLKKKDEVAYLRFASVFKSFGSGKRFVKELNKLEKKQEIK